MENRYGVDVTYFKRWIARAFKDLTNYKPDELARELARMSRTADESVLLEPEFAGSARETEQAARIAELEVAALEFTRAISLHHSIHLDGMIGGSTRRALSELLDLINKGDE